MLIFTAVMQCYLNADEFYRAFFCEYDVSTCTLKLIAENCDNR